jgi:hypothetical protein
VRHHHIFAELVLIRPEAFRPPAITDVDASEGDVWAFRIVNDTALFF